jgi:hypothetical protein
MVQIIVVIREAGSEKIDYSLHFDVPEVPSAGAYISVTRTGDREPYSEDLIVRHVWWRLSHPENAAISSGEPKVGSLTEIFVECDIAEGPYASDAWRRTVNSARNRGLEVPAFEVRRFSVPESTFEKGSE